MQGNSFAPNERKIAAGSATRSAMGVGSVVGTSAGGARNWQLACSGCSPCVRWKSVITTEGGRFRCCGDGALVPSPDDRSARSRIRTWDALRPWLPVPFLGALGNLGRFRVMVPPIRRLRDIWLGAVRHVVVCVRDRQIHGRIGRLLKNDTNHSNS